MTHLGGGYTCKNCGTYHRTTVVCNCKQKTNNMAQQTALMELLDWVKATLPMDLDTPRMIEEKIESLLPKERTQIIDAHDVGYIDGANKKNETSEQYYNETYKGQVNVEQYAWDNPVLSRKDVYELFNDVFKDKKMEGAYKISASKQVYQFNTQLRELAKQKAIDLIKDTTTSLNTQNK